MYKTHSTQGLAERGDGWQTHWLLHEAAGATNAGMLAVTTIEGGGALGSLVHSEAEQAVFVLSGEGAIQTAEGEQPVAAGAFAFAPSGAAHRWRAGEKGLRLLRVYGGIARPQDVAAGAGEDSTKDALSVVVTRADEVRFMTITNPDQGFFNMRATFLVDEQNGGSKLFAIGQSIFEDPRNSRPMHLHPNAPEFLFVVEGRGFHIEPDGREVLIEAGDACITPAGEPHGFRFEGEQPARFIFGFLGVGSFEKAGTELVGAS